jgi:outer membrane murein-binding lipoprotein Lpp
MPSARSQLGRMKGRLAQLAAALLASSLLAGCATTATTATTAKAQCAAWRAITYSSKNDTAETVRQVRVHNRTGQKIRCWQ